MLSIPRKLVFMFVFCPGNRSFSASYFRSFLSLCYRSEAGVQYSWFRLWRTRLGGIHSHFEGIWFIFVPVSSHVIISTGLDLEFDGFQLVGERCAMKALFSVVQTTPVVGCRAK